MGQANSRQEAFWDACGFGRTHLVKKFIEEGIDINWVSFTHDCCPIHVASQGKPDVVKLLIDAKCDISVQDTRGMTALHHAAMKGEEEIVTMLVEAGCELNTQDKNGWTALHNAAYWAHVGVVQELIKVGASVGMANKHQRLALHEVARSQSSEKAALGQIAQLLISAGSDVDAVSSDFGEADFTSLMFAAYHGHTEVAKALVDSDCDLNANGSINKWTALHWAADRGHQDIVYMLLEAGADVTKKNMSGETAAERAKEGSELREYLQTCVLSHSQGGDGGGGGGGVNGVADDRASISSSQSFNAQTALDTAVAIEKITAQTKSSASASAFVPITMPPLSIATAEERKRNIRLGINRRTSGSSASGPTSPGWSPGSAPHVELASDGSVSSDPNIQLLRSFQDRLNRRIDQASRTLQEGLLRPEADPSPPSPSSSPHHPPSPSTQSLASTAGATSSSSPSSSREVASKEITPGRGIDSTDGASCDEEGGEKPSTAWQGGEGVRGDVSHCADGLSADVQAVHLGESGRKGGERSPASLVHPQQEREGQESSAMVQNHQLTQSVAQSKAANGNVSAAPSDGQMDV